MNKKGNMPPAGIHGVENKVLAKRNAAIFESIIVHQLAKSRSRKTYKTLASIVRVLGEVPTKHIVMRVFQK